MSAFDEWDQLAEQVVKGADDAVLQKLIQQCTPFLRRMASRDGFSKVLLGCGADALYRDAVADAIMRSHETGKPFRKFVRNCMRNVCRRENRARRVRNLSDIVSGVSSGESTAIFGAADERSWAPDVAVERIELGNLAQEELLGEDPLCQKVIALHCQGSPFVEIGAELGIAEGSARSVKHHNLDRIRVRLRKRADSLFDD